MPAGWFEIQNAVAAVVAGYLLGALPFAHLGGRINGVDVFSTGNTLAGTANVFWNIGRRAGTLVFVGDVAKGAAAVIVAGLLDVSPPIVLLAGAAAIVGHWKSVFTSFRGGDGMAPLMGVALALAPPLAAVGAAVGVAAIVLMRRSVLRSTWGISSCFLVMLAASQVYRLDRELVWGLTALAALVLLRSLITRRRRGHTIFMEPGVGLDTEGGDLDADPELPNPLPREI